MKILIVNEMGTGRDSQHRISMIAKIIKEAYPESFITLALKKPLDERFVAKRFVDKFIHNPVVNFPAIASKSLSQSIHMRFFDSHEKTQSIKDFWKNLLSENSPDMVIADNAPIAAMMCELYGVKHVRVGTGNFTLKTKGLTDSDFTSIHKVSRAMYRDGDVDCLAPSSLEIILGCPQISGGFEQSSEYCFFDSEKEDDGGLNLDILAYIKDNDPTKDAVLEALDQINSEMNKNILVIMPSVKPILYRPNFEVTPNFVRLQGALYNSPLCIHNFGSGMLLDCIKSGSPTWGVPYTQEQATNRLSYSHHVEHTFTAKTKNSIKASIIDAIVNKDNNRDEIKKVWSKALKMGISPLSAVLTGAI